MDPPPLLVCAIDFGTTYSGYAFSFPTSKDKITMCKKWGQCVGNEVAFKTPTCCLVQNDGGKFVAFGYEAQKAFCDMPHEEMVNHSYFANFKMHLHRHKHLARNTYIVPRMGVNMAAMEIFAMGLRYLADHMATVVETQTSSRPTNDQVRWVVTVPAIWSDAAKQFMREAAVKAGLIDMVDSQKLVIALEPEAASLWCRQLDNCGLSAGTRYLVMDCGGGTLDVTAHRVAATHQVTEIWPPTGADLGAAQVNVRFEELLKDVFSDAVISDYQDNNRADWLGFLVQFETKKKAMDPDKVVRTNMTLSSALGKSYSDVTGEKIKNAISAEWKARGMSVSTGMLRVPHATMLGLFAEVVEGVVKHVRTLLEASHMSAITHILLVGGFGESRVLQRAIKRAFDGRLKVIVPEEASLCVMQGATLFGHDGSLIAARRARKTYGTDVYPEFDASKHDPNKTKTFDKKRRAEGLFQVWIRNGDELPLGKVMKFQHAPVTPTQSNMSIGLYACEARHPQYVSEPGVQHIGDITVNLPGEGSDRRVEVTVRFGGTEITVEGRDVRSNTATKATIDFLHTEN